MLTYQDYVRDPAGGFRQRDLTVTQTYDAAYLYDRYDAIDANVQALARRRLDVLRAVTGIADNTRLLDFGCGTGRFVDWAIHAGLHALGHDLVHAGQLWPSFFVADPCDALPFDVVTFFDSLEHLPAPAAAVRRLAPTWLMVSVPECHYPQRPEWFMPWKHRRPGEHLWHWNRRSLAGFLGRMGYAEVMVSSFEDAYRPNPAQPEPNILTGIYRRRDPRRVTPPPRRA